MIEINDVACLLKTARWVKYMLRLKIFHLLPRVVDHGKCGDKRALQFQKWLVCQRGENPRRQRDDDGLFIGEISSPLSFWIVVVDIVSSPARLSARAFEGSQRATDNR